MGCSPWANVYKKKQNNADEASGIVQTLEQA